MATPLHINLTIRCPITGERDYLSSWAKPSGRAALVIGSGRANISLEASAAELREIAAALVRVADEIEPQTIMAGNVVAREKCRTCNGAGTIRPRLDLCHDCGGHGYLYPNNKPADAAMVEKQKAAAVAAAGDDSTDALLRPTAPSETCGDCGGTGINGPGVDDEGRPWVIDCKRCEGLGKLYPTGTAEPGQQVAKFDGIAPLCPGCFQTGKEHLRDCPNY